MKNLYLLSGILILVFSLSYSQEVYRLSYNFEQGKSYRYLDLITTKSTQEMMGKETRMDVKVEMLHRFNVDSILENGNFILSFSLDSIRSEITSKFMDTVFTMKDVPGINKKLEIDKLGNVINKKAKDKVALGSLIADEMLPDKFDLHVFSDKELRIGEKWETTLYDTIEAKSTKIVSKTKTVYTVLKKENKLERNCLKIEYEAETESEGKIEMMGDELYFENNVDAEGVFWYDPVNKLIVYEEADISDNTSITHTGPNSMIIPVTQQTKLIRKLVE